MKSKFQFAGVLILLLGISIPLTPYAANSPSKFDIVGLYLGMPLNDANALLKNYKPPMQINEMPADISSIRGSRIKGLRYLFSLTASQIRTHSTPTDEKITLNGYAPPNDAAVRYIKRYQHIGSQPMLHTDLRKMLVEKYGSPTLESPPDASGRSAYYTMAWVFKPDGSPLTQKKAVNSCIKSENILLSSMSEAEKYHKQCGVTLFVQMGTGHAGPKEHYMINSYSITLYDVNKTLKMNQKTVDFSIIEAKKLEEESIRKAAGANKPRL